MGHVVRMTLYGAFGITFVFLVDLANLFWLSQLGDETLVAAIGFAFAVQFFSVSSGVGMMIATTAIVSRRIGMGARAQARKEGTAALLLTTGFQTFVALSIVVFRYPLLELVGAEGETLHLAARYLFFTVPSLVVMAVGLAGSAILRAEGDGRRAMFVTLSGGLFLMVVDPILILWLGWGLDGAAIGLVIFRLLLAVQALRYVIFTHNLLARPSLQDLYRCAPAFFAVALPALLTQMAPPFANFMLTGVIAPFGDSAIAAWAVVNRITVVAFGGIFSLSGAIGGIFGQNYGAGLWQRVNSTYKDALIFAFAYTLVTWAILLATTSAVVATFGLTGAGSEVYRAFSFVGAGGFLLVGALFVAVSAFNNLGHPGWATLVTWLRDGILILPAAWWAASVVGAPGAIYAQTFVGAAVGIFAAIWGWLYIKAQQRNAVPTLRDT